MRARRVSSGMAALGAVGQPAARPAGATMVTVSGGDEGDDHGGAHTDPPPPPDAPAGLGVGLGRVLGYFLRLGTIGFGGPIATRRLRAARPGGTPRLDRPRRVLEGLSTHRGAGCRRLVQGSALLVP